MEDFIMENLTEMVFILDRSGSMAGLEKDTIGGFNSLLEKQKKEKGKALVTTMLFDDDFTLVHDRQPIHRVAPLTEEQYFVRGCTALLDAIGLTISHIKKGQKGNAEGGTSGSDDCCYNHGWNGKFEPAL